MTSPVAFYFDFISPYAHVAWHRIHDVCAPGGRAVRAVPVLFAALLDENGQLGPAEIPHKRVYTFKDAFRKGHRLGVPPLSPPPAHPFNPLLALRVATALEGDPAQRGVVDALFAATWGGGGGVESPDDVRRALAPLGIDVERALVSAVTDEVKGRLRTATTEALSRGAFGVPTMIVDDELFWGVDALEHLADFLAGRDPLPGEAMARWRDLPTSATRRPKR